MRFPRNLNWACSTSMVAPNLRTSLATKLLKMMLLMEDFPEPDLPMRRIFFLAGLNLVGSMLGSLVTSKGQWGI